jgi:hypothetical protein
VAAAKKRKRVPAKNKTAVDEAELAIILSHAATFGAKATSKQFGLSVRTIQRHQARLTKGEAPNLAARVAVEHKAAVERSRDKLHLCLDKLLDRVMELAPNATMGQAIEATDKIGGLMVTRQAFGGTNDAQPGVGANSADKPTQDPSGTGEGGRVIKGAFGSAGN